MKNHTLAEIKEELFREISLLEQIEPKYLKCRKCPYKGKCCIDNDIDIREDEWTEIKDFLDHNEEAREEVYQNFIHDRKCYFRIDRCCLIHDIRPTNCIYTPYQVIQNRYDHTLYYSSMDEECNFVIRESGADEPVSIDGPILYLEEEKCYYLFLNHWFEEFENQSEGTYKMLAKDRLAEYFAVMKKDC